MEKEKQTGDIPTVQPLLYNAMIRLNEIARELRDFGHSPLGVLLIESEHLVRIEENIDDAISELGEVIGTFVSHEIQISR